MNRRKAENIIWAMNAAVIIVYTVFFVIFGMSETIIPGVIFAVIMLIMLCGSFFSEEKTLEALLVAYGIFSLGLMFMCNRLWCGIIMLTATSLCSCFDVYLSSKKRHIFLNLCFLAIGLFFSLKLTQDWKNTVGITTVMIWASVLIIFGIIWSLFLYFLNTYVELNSTLEKAIKASALDAMNERQLRMEMAETKNLAEENARLEERERISRDIHNAVGHTLSAATVTLDAAQMLIDTDKEKANMKIDQANDRIHEAIGSVRSVVRTLEAEDDTVLVVDYVASLKEMLNNFTLDTEIKVHHNLDMILAEEERRKSLQSADGNPEKNEGKLHIARAAFISSAVSELLTNGVKHGGATVFVVLITLDGNHIGIQVNDNGTGWGDIPYEEKQRKLNAGFGLKKLENYVKTNAGTFEVDGSEGFCVKIMLPR